MQIVLYIQLVFLWSSSTLANDSTLDLSKMKNLNTFVTKIDPIYNSEKVSETVIVSNMPRIRSQDSFNTCVGCSTATIMQRFICQTDPKYKDKKCDDLNLQDEISQFDLVSKTLTNLDGQSPIQPSNHKNLRITNKDSSKRDAVLALLAIQGINNKFYSEKCYPFDKLVKVYGYSSGKKIEELLELTEEVYEKSKQTEAKDVCIECLEKIKSGFILDTDINKIQSVIKDNSNKTFGEFLFALILKKECEDKITLTRNPSINQFPMPQNENDKRSLTQDEKAKLLLEKIKLNLGNKNLNKPLNLSNICMFYDKNQNRCASHSIVISGYKEMCTSDLKKCMPMLKVQNCWGSDWQKENNDGWVDAEKLLTKVNYTIPTFSDGVLSWVE